MFLPAPLPKPVVCYVTDRRSLPLALSSDAIRMLLRSIESAAAAGADWIQVREKDLCGGETLEVTRAALPSIRVRAPPPPILATHPAALQSIRVRAPHTRILVNDRVDVALAAGAGGVHLSENGFSVSDARRLCERFAHDAGKPLDFLIGVSCHSLGAALGATRDGADY